MIKLKIKYGNSQTDLRFPCTEKEMSAALERIHAEDVTPLELYLSEVIFPKELGCLQDRFVNLDEVNFLAKRMDSFFGDEEYQFYEAMKSEGFDPLPDLINLSFNLNRYPLIQDIGDMGKIGREYLLTVKGCLPADDADDVFPEDMLGEEDDEEPELFPKSSIKNDNLITLTIDRDGIIIGGAILYCTGPEKTNRNDFFYHRNIRTADSEPPL